MPSVDLRSFEGQRVSLALGDGSRIDDCQLVSAPRGQVDRVWVCAGGQDLFLAVEDIADVWPARRR
jgi:hypothetical protein